MTEYIEGSFKDSWTALLSLRERGWEFVGSLYYEEFDGGRHIDTWAKEGQRAVIDNSESGNVRIMLVARRDQ